ncbi:MAG: PilZ domain-containing protein [Planctomycetota bacterium]
MGRGQAVDKERRRDSRVKPQGRVRATSIGPGLPVEGRLVDVSAGGLRLAVEGTELPDVGTKLRLEIHVLGEGGAKTPPEMVLEGTGRLVWTGAGGGGEHEAGLCFDQPVKVRPIFPDVKVF